MDNSQNRILQSYKDFWTRFLDVKGRSTRPELWHPFWINLVIFTFLGIISASILSVIFALVIIIPSFAVTARRLHDTNHTMFLAILSHINGLILIIVNIVFIVILTKAANSIAEDESDIIISTIIYVFKNFNSTITVLLFVGALALDLGFLFVIIAPITLYFLVISGNEDPNDYGSEGTTQIITQEDSI
ncbi:DUF805 domain-containing protein [Mammaliicoccus vitulinus]|uniref:DUF805 domain-containing protein n=2 Tax=Mammaliicoccus vitulinus TaxID=71237 RepID=A0A2T4PQM0_9STAP|nr:DUF805 domain-containing protein [Mammaliicoccus vitulinus]PTI28132.1 DUF805 domain-containing protein [Mammaliicoccus vitulinus]